jgi:colanic acid biosynthesis glycosyl transferase WcaI
MFRAMTLPKADVYLVVSPPLLLGPCARILSQLFRRPYVFHVQDLQPDAAAVLGMVKNGFLLRLLYRAEGFSYRGAAAVSGISAGMIRSFRDKQVPPERCCYLPNWTGRRQTTDDLLSLPESAPLRARLGVPAGAFLAVYSGNLGHKQGLEILIEAAVLLDARNSAPIEGSSRRVHILIVGDGAARRRISESIARAGLQNVSLLPLLPVDQYGVLLRAADVGLVTQLAGTGQYFFPSKVLTMLAAQLPLVTVADADSELAEAGLAGGFGVNVRPDAAGALADTLLALANDAEWLARLRRSTTWVAQFQRDIVLRGFTTRLEEVASTYRSSMGSPTDR